MNKIASAIILVVVLLGGALWWVANMAPADPVGVDNPRVRLVPAGKPMAGYFRLSNRTDTALRLVGASSDAFGRVMMHRTITTDGQSRMVHQDVVVVAPGESVAFEPGGLHLMLLSPAADLAVGDAVEIALEFEGREPASMPVAFTVVPVTSQ